MKQQGDDYLFSWENPPVEIAVREVSVGRDGPRAEVWVRHEQAGHLHVAMLNLLSTSGKKSFSAALAQRDGSTAWDDALEYITVLSVEAYRHGNPLELLEPKRRPEAGRYALNPLIPLAQPTLWYGDGKSAKSYLLKAACRAMTLAIPLAGLETQEMLCAFLDWEWDKDEHEDRLLRLGGDATFFYRRCSAPLTQQVRALKRELDQHAITFIGIDSLGLACGGDPSKPEFALPLFSAVRELGRTAVVIHHTPKEKTQDPYGSAYIRNSARAGWLFLRQAAEEEVEARIALRNTWSNVGKTHQPIGLRFSFDEEAYTTTISSTDAKPILRLVGAASRKDSILDFLREQPGAEVQEIAEALGERNVGVISVHLSQMKKTGLVANSDRRWSLAYRGET